MNKKQLLSLYGLKWNPFCAELPEDALISSAKIDGFCWRVENLVREGGFALVTGDTGMGKSVTLRILYERLSALRDVTIAELSRPQSNIPDFYRELGVCFGVDLNVSNRWGGYSILRERWKAHIESTFMRPLLIIDEAQEMNRTVLSELRLLSSIRFDSQLILTVVLCGDSRLPEKFRCKELAPLGTRIRTRLSLDRWSKEELGRLLEESLQRAGAPTLMTRELVHALSEHAMGSPRIMMNMAQELLMTAAREERPKLDEKLYFEVFAPETTARPKQKRRSA